MYLEEHYIIHSRSRTFYHAVSASGTIHVTDLHVDAVALYSFMVRPTFICVQVRFIGNMT